LAKDRSFSSLHGARPPEGLPGAPNRKGVAYTGPFGPAFGWHADSYRTELIGVAFGSASVGWGASGVRGSRRKALRAGMAGEIAGRPVCISRRRAGWSREARALRIDFEDRVYSYRLRKWTQHWLDRGDEVGVIRRRAVEGEVLEGADAWDVAIFALLQASGLEREVDFRPLLFLFL